MTSFPIAIAPTGGTAVSRATNAAPIFQQPIVYAGGNSSIDSLNALTTLAQTIGNQNNVVASQYVPVAAVAAAADSATSGVPAPNASVSNLQNIFSSSTYVILGVIAIAACLFGYILLRKRSG